MISNYHRNMIQFILLIMISSKQLTGRVTGLISIYNLTKDPYESNSIYDELFIEEYQLLFEKKFISIKSELLNITAVTQSGIYDELYELYLTLF